MVETTRTLTEVLASLQEQAIHATTVEEMREAMRLGLEELTCIEHEVACGEGKTLVKWRTERQVWVTGYRRIFREIPCLLARMQAVVAALTEDTRFCQAPAEVQERLRNRKEGLEILCRMVARLPQRAQTFDTMVHEDNGGLTQFDLAVWHDASRLAATVDPSAARVTVTEILEAVAGAVEQVREANYQRTRELRQEAERLRQAILGFLKDHLLPVVDGLERGLEDAAALRRPLCGYPEARAVIEQWFGAYPRCARHMQDFLKAIGLRRLRVRRGDAFDPRWHLALEHDTCATLQDGQIVDVLRSGWHFRTLLLRPAEVIVVRNAEGNRHGP